MPPSAHPRSQGVRHGFNRGADRGSRFSDCMSNRDAASY
jgi:hypothetical protein